MLNEFVAVLRRKFQLDWDATENAVADLRVTLDPVRSIDVSTHTEAVVVARTYGLSFYDSLIVAAALEAGSDTLLTEDLQAGQRIGSLTVINPFA